jgi:hypothetical protein
VRDVLGVAAAVDAAPSGESSSTRFDSFGQEVAVVGDEQHRALEVASASISISLVAMSRWLVGSSSTRKFGGSNSILAITRRAFSPPDSTRQGFSTSSPEKPNSRRACAATPCPPAGRRSEGLEDRVSSPSSRSIECWAK